jgi:hypothetical protein
VQRTRKTTNWGKIVGNIEKCPMRAMASQGRDVTGRLWDVTVRLWRGGSVSFTKPVTASTLPIPRSVKTEAILVSLSDPSHKTVATAYDDNILVPFSQPSHKPLVLTSF